MAVQLHARSWYSFLAGGSSPESLAERAVEVGIQTLAITDRLGVQGAIRFQKACENAGIQPVFGAEVDVEGDPIVLLARSRSGYANLCEILTEAHLSDRDAPSIPVDALPGRVGDLFCLTGGMASRLYRHIDQGETSAARRWVDRLAGVFGEALSIEVTHHLLPGDQRRVRALLRLSDASGVPPVAAGDVRYARRAHHRRYDLMTCIRLGITVFENHPERPKNDEAFLRPEAEMRRLIPHPPAFKRAQAIGRACRVDLLPEHLTTPAARYDAEDPPHAFLETLCREGWRRRYPKESVPAERRRTAWEQMDAELQTIGDLQLSEYFLVVREVSDAATQRGIRCAGRGSAANSIVAYLLGITDVDPVAHNLLFERFLHRGRKGTPDIDMDFDSDRRDEVINWMEERFGREETAMTATLVTYQIRSTLRDVAKALGWPIGTLSDLTAAVPRHTSDVRAHRQAIERVLGASPLIDTLLAMTEALMGAPRHLGLHSGGMVLSRRPLRHFSPVQRSANGVRMVQFDKRDVEDLGLVKLDVLGLRMLSAISEAETLIERHIQPDLDLDDLPLDDIQTFNLIRSGRTVGLFQIESQGQHHLLAQHQPDTFQDLVTEIALFRPGPLQGNMVHPFVRRRRGEEPVQYDHPSLEPILRDTYGIILFQEQVLEVAHVFAGMPLDEADDFRALMSKFRDPGAMEDMRERFVEGAIATQGARRETAEHVFDQVSGFVGYGFCRSHAAAFAKHVYLSAYLKAHHPAAFLAAVMEHRPGMYSQMTLEEEARRFGVTIRPPDIHRSGTRFDLEPAEPDSPDANSSDADPGSGASSRRPARRGVSARGVSARGVSARGIDRRDPPAYGTRQLEDRAWAIRKPLTAVKNVSGDDAQAIVWERLRGAFQSVEDFYRRVPMSIEALRSLARSGALDDLSRDGRTALWEVGVLHRRGVVPGQGEPDTLFQMDVVQPEDVPDLVPLTEAERLSWDLETHGAARRHPMLLARRYLTDLEIRTVETCYRFGRTVPIQEGGAPPVLTIAGISILRQKPGSANGVMFLTLEDETGYIQCVIYETVQKKYQNVFSQGALVVRGELQVEGNWRGLIVRDAWTLDGLFGGYEGYPSMSGGRDRWVQRPTGSRGRSGDTPSEEGPLTSTVPETADIPDRILSRRDESPGSSHGSESTDRPGSADGQDVRAHVELPARSESGVPAGTNDRRDED